MKKLLLVALIATSLYAFTACTKSNDGGKSIHDTTVIFHKDTTVVIHKDTVIKKDTVYIAAPKNPIAGYWVGTYQITGAESLGNFYYGYSIFSDGTFIQQGGGTNGQQFTGKGTWTMAADSTWSGDLSNTDISQGAFTQHISAKYSSVNGTLTQGTWIYTTGTNTGQHGTFSLKRTN